METAKEGIGNLFVGNTKVGLTVGVPLFCNITV